MTGQGERSFNWTVPDFHGSDDDWPAARIVTASEAAAWPLLGGPLIWGNKPWVYIRRPDPNPFPRIRLLRWLP